MPLSLYFSLVPDGVHGFTTTVGSLHLVTFGPITNDPAIRLFLYEQTDANHVKVYWADEKVFAQAILGGKLQGRAHVAWLFGPVVEKVTDSPENLREFLEKAGKSCFDMKTPAFTLERLSRKF